MVNTVAYTGTQIALHWLIALLIVLCWLIEQETVHIALGLAMLALLFARIVLRRRHGAPDPSPGTGPMAALAAHWGHLALYALMVVVPLVGVVLWLADSKPAEEVHEITANLLMLLALGHAAAAIWHQWVKHDGTMDRMRPARRAE